MMLGTGGAVWGLDLGDSALKAVKVAKAGAKLAIQDFQVIRYRELAGENKARKKEDMVFQALMEFFRRPDRQRSRFVASIPSQNVFSRFIGLPPVQKNRVAEIVRYEARQQIPFDLSEVIWDYQLVRPDFMPGEEIEIGLFAVKKDVVNSFLNQFVMAQDWLEGIQIAPLALYNFVRFDGQADKPTVIIDVGSQSTDLLIVQDTKFWLRNLPIAGNSFNAILEKKFNISADEAENVKVNLAQSKHRRTVFEVLKPALKDLVAEIQRSVGYYKSLAGDVKFDEVLLMGEGFKLYGLHKFLSDQLQYRVRPLSEVREIAYAGKADREEEFKTHLPGLAVAIGLGLQGMRAGEVTVDLVPEEFVLRRELKRKRGPAALAVGLLWLSILALFMGAKMSVWSIENFRIQRMETKPDGTRAQVTVDKEGIKKLIERAKALANDYGAAQGQVRMGVLEQFRPLGQLRDYWSEAIAGLVRAIPQTPPIIIDRVQVASGGGGSYEGDRQGGGGGGGGGGGQAAFTFDATADSRYTETVLNVELKRHLEDARVYPEGVKLFKEVQVGVMTFHQAGGEGATRPGFGDVPPGPASFSRAPDELRATVTCVLRTKDEIAADLDKAREEAARKASEAKAGDSAGAGK